MRPKAQIKSSNQARRSEVNSQPKKRNQIDEQRGETKAGSGEKLQVTRMSKIMFTLSEERSNNVCQTFIQIFILH